jgi:hypothetical protein
MAKASTKKIVIRNAVKHWVIPRKYGCEITILDEKENVTNIECHIDKKYREHDEEIFRK